MACLTHCLFWAKILVGSSDNLSCRIIGMEMLMHMLAGRSSACIRAV